LLKVYKNEFAIFKSNLDIRSALILINDAARDDKFKGFSVVIDENEKYLGVITDGDFRRLSIDQVDTSKTVGHVVSSRSIFLTIEEARSERIRDIVTKKSALAKKRVNLIPVVDSSQCFLGLVDMTESVETFKVVVYGLGFVGITLSGFLASSGVQVTGVDVKQSLIYDLKNGVMHVREPGLLELITHSLDVGTLNLTSSPELLIANVHIVTVGTPVDRDGQINDKALREVVESIALNLKKNDQVVLRSTVPMGTTRAIVIPMLQRVSGLIAGEDFFVSFAPERTIEGDAIRELRDLPQIVGGYTEKCVEVASNFWGRVSPVVVEVESLEAAELVKLANNSFRDLSFAFANQVGLLAEIENIDAFDLILKANYGYPRNKIPLPSPGVGGYCLTKDPYLLESSFKSDSREPLQSIARRINDKSALLAVNKLEKHALRIGKALSDLSVLVVGIAFKGMPETNDMRGSCALDLIGELVKKSVDVRVWDAVVSDNELSALGLKAFGDLESADKRLDAILVMNNHPDNRRIETTFKDCRDCLIFDGWHTLDKKLIINSKNFVYSTIGYMEK
jgi:UDP-N-acetyl-D-mannosaminuronic acid dehydrogenase